MSPFVLRDTRFGVRFGVEPSLECSLLVTLTDQLCKLPMALTAENLADKFKITRDDVDNFALQSQQRWADAHQRGSFQEEIVPLDIKVKGKLESMKVDEHPRPQTTIEGLKKLPSLFKKEGTVTAGNASVSHSLGSIYNFFFSTYIYSIYMMVQSVSCPTSFYCPV